MRGKFVVDSGRLGRAFRRNPTLRLQQSPCVGVCKKSSPQPTALLIVGEGSIMGGSNYQMWAVHTNPASTNYYGDADSKPVTLKLPEPHQQLVANSPLGIADMALGADGHTLVITLPCNIERRGLSSVWILDLATLNPTTGTIGTLVEAQGYSIDFIKSPQIVTAVPGDPDRYLIATPTNNAYNVTGYVTGRGLSTLTLTRDSDGRINNAELKNIPTVQPDNAIVFDRLDIQRAQSAVLVTVDGVEYAIVADDNMAFLDPYVKAMFEMPEIILNPANPLSPITSYGGGASAKQVAQGGKLGIVRDPFGEAKYLGATKPLDGYAIMNLSLSEDGKVMIGQLKTGLGAYEIYDLSEKAHQNHAWNVEALIRAALEQPEQDYLRKPIVPPIDSVQLIPMQGNIVSVPAGTEFDPYLPKARVSGNMGDVIEVDLKEWVEKALIEAEVREQYKDNNLVRDQAWVDVMVEAEVIRRKALRESGKLGELKLTNFYIANETVKRLTEKDARDEINAQLSVITRANDPAVIYSGINGTDDYRETGIVYFVPNITQGDLVRLRNGQRLDDKSVSMLLTFELNGESKSSLLTVTAKDFKENDKRMFFGDRPLENPGYGIMTLSGTVGEDGDNNRLDVYKVEQRLKYLGFSAFRKQGGNLQEFVVDGVWEESKKDSDGIVTKGKEGKETSALRAFYGMTHYTYDKDNLAGETGLPNVKGYANTNIDAAKQVVPGLLDTNTNYGWLNAYNAPHLVNLYSALYIPDNKGGLSSTHKYFLRGGINEDYTTSWMYDLLRAWEETQKKLVGLQATTLVGPDLLPKSITPTTPDHTVARLNGATRPQGGVSGVASHDTGAHSLGMGLDWGFIDQFVREGEIKNNVNGTNYNGSNYSISIDTQDWDTNSKGGIIWSVANAISAINQVATSVPPNSLNVPNEEKALRNFLSLYNLTRGDAIPNNGSWEEIAIVNGRTPVETYQIRAALFGSGTLTNPLINHVYIGDKTSNANRWQRSLAALNLLSGHKAEELKNTDGSEKKNADGSEKKFAENSNGHYHHYHIDFNAPKRLPLEPSQNLMAGSSVSGASGASYNLSILHEAALELAQEWGLSENDMDFYFPPDLESTNPPMVIIAAADKAKTREKAVGVCSVVDVVKPFSFGVYARGYLIKYYGKDKDPMEFDLSRVEPKILAITRQPKHGILTLHDEEPDGYAVYRPDEGYLGKDRVEALVAVGDDVVRVVFNFVVNPSERSYEQLSDSEHKKLCPKGSWIISDASPQNPALATLLSTAATALVGFSDLPGSAVAQTTGYYNSGQIILDTNAAGWGWYIDPTPLDNTDDYLPTADPNIWKAKPGSGAEGRMDMLSVLLHEYGHVLGLEHSNDPRDFMATTLQPGERRLPSNAELQLMADLIAEVKGEMNLASSSTPAQPNNNPFNNPLPAAVVIPAFIVPRQNRYLGVVNPTLLNGNFGTGDTGGWETYGEVTVSDNKAILTESPTAQTRLTQAFMLEEDDRALSFTISKQNLIANRSGPGDAFEVALLDANTGLPVAGIIDLSRSDALLNIQTDGTERLAQGMKKIINADGSATYIIALPEALADTPVLLSFDLLGFGFGANSAESSVTLSNIGPGDGEGLCPTLPATATPTRYRFDFRK